MAGEMTPRKALAAVRKLLKSGEQSSIHQGISLAFSLGMPEVTDTLAAGILIDEDGVLSCTPASEVHKRIASDLRAQAMLYIGRSAGLFDGAKQIVVAKQFDVGESVLWDLSPLEGLSELEHLDLHRTRFSSADLQCLGTLTGLTFLNIAYPHYRTIDAPDLSFLPHLTRLETLALAGYDNLADLTPLASLLALQHLDIQGTACTDLGPLSGLSALKTLRLPGKGAKLQLSPLEGLSGLVEGVSVSKNGRLTSQGKELKGVDAWRAICVGFPEISELRHLDLEGPWSSYDIAPPDLEPLKKLTGLETLCLHFESGFSNSYALPDLSPLESLKEMKVLTIQTRRYLGTCDSLSVLSSLPELETLGLKRLNLPDLSILTSLPKLSSLSLKSSKNVDLAQLVGCSALCSITLDGVEPLPDMRPLRQLPGVVSQVTVSEGRLCFAGHPCSGLRAYMALWAAPDKHAGIEELKLNQVHGGADLEALRGCVDLKRLDLSVTHLRENAESGEIPLAVLADLVKLEELSLAGSDGLGELSPLIPLGALRHLDTGSTDVKPKPKKTVLDTREEVAAYQKTLARVLKRKDGRTPAEEAWLTGVNTEVKRSTLPADSRKAMAQLRKLLKASDWDSVKQAVELATALGMPEIMATLSEGVSLDADGRLVVGTNSEIHKRVKATMRMPAAFLVACASGLLEGVTVLDLGMEREDRAFLTDLSPLAGHTSILHLKIQLFPITDLSPLETLVNLEVLDIMGCSHLEDVTPLSKLTSLRRLKMDGCSGLTDLSPLAGCASLHEGIEVQGGRLRDTSIEPKQDGGEHPEITGWSVVPVLYSRHPDLGKVTHLNLNRADNLVDLKALEGMGALEELEARCDNLSDLTGLSHCPKLSLLDLRPKNDWRFDGVPLSGLQDLRQLHELKTLALRDWASGGLEPLAELHNLRRLDLERCSQISDLAPLNGLVDMELLELSENWNSSFDIRALAGMVGLASGVSIEGGEVKRDGAYVVGLALAVVLNAQPAALAEATRLNFATCRSLRDLTPLQVCGELKELDLTACGNVESLTPLASLRHLEILHLRDVRCLHTLTVLPSVKEVRLPGVTGTEENFEFLRNLPGLERLFVQSSRRGTAPASAPFSALTALKQASFAGCSQFGEVYGLLSLENLEKLDLRSCTELTPRPEAVSMESAEAVTGYRKRLARSLLRHKDRPSGLEELVPLAEALLA